MEDPTKDRRVLRERRIGARIPANIILMYRGADRRTLREPWWSEEFVEHLRAKLHPPLTELGKALVDPESYSL